ncbi:hypothetical protein Ddc_01239 [Ditylenchus destructor]|nr:hypothetical protein Ddc_01239 [Ditylenchus destructor]
MPSLPLPDEKSQKKIAQFRRIRKALLKKSISGSGGDVSATDFDNIREESKAGPQKIFNEIDEAVPSTSKEGTIQDAVKGDAGYNQRSIDDNAECATEIPTTLKVIAKGEGFMAISASIDGSEYTGMLYKNDRHKLE